jgi:hypothetical protein
VEDLAPHLFAVVFRTSDIRKADKLSAKLHRTIFTTDEQVLDASREPVAISRISFSLPSGPSSAPKASFDRQE